MFRYDKEFTEYQQTEAYKQYLESQLSTPSHKKKKTTDAAAKIHHALEESEPETGRDHGPQAREPLHNQFHHLHHVECCLFSRVVADPVHFFAGSGSSQSEFLTSDPDPGSYWHLKNQFKHQIFFYIKHISSDI